MSLKTRVESDKSLMSLVRHAVTEYAKTRGGFEGEALGDIELAVGEALANAVEHGHCDGGWISTSCIYDDDAFKVTIRDSGLGFDYVRMLDAPTASSSRGFGLTIMRRAMDDVQFQSGGRAVTMIKQNLHE